MRDAGTSDERRALLAPLAVAAALQAAPIEPLIPLRSGSFAGQAERLLQSGTNERLVKPLLQNR